MNTKAKGTRNELEFKHCLEAMHYDVSKAGASLGVYDLKADNLDDGFSMFTDLELNNINPKLRKHTEVIRNALKKVEPPALYRLLIQSKSNNLPSKKEILRIAKTSVRDSHAKLIVVRNDHKTWEIWRVFTGCSYKSDNVWIHNLIDGRYKGWKI